jgi:hypothetical protein
VSVRGKGIAKDTAENDSNEIDRPGVDRGVEIPIQEKQPV